MYIVMGQYLLVLAKLNLKCHIFIFHSVSEILYIVKSFFTMTLFIKGQPVKIFTGLYELFTLFNL